MSALEYPLHPHTRSYQVNKGGYERFRSPASLVYIVPNLQRENLSLLSTTSYRVNYRNSQSSIKHY